MPKEIWLPVRERPVYEVSNYGRVRRGSRILKGSLHTYGYPVVTLTLGGPRKIGRFIHVLVLEAFVGPRPSGNHQCAHWDGNRTNSRLRNLRWATVSENAEDKRRHGTMLFGEKAGPFRWTANDIRRMRRLSAIGFNQHEIAEEMGCHQPQISKVLRREIWKHVP